MLFEQIHYRGGVANIDVLMLVIAKVRDQVVARFFRGSFGAKKLCAHVVIDAKDMRAISRETPHAFRANQSRRTCNDDRAHHNYRSTTILPVGLEGVSPAELWNDRQDACRPHSQDGWATIRQSSMSPHLRKDSLARREIAGRKRAHAQLAVDFSTRRRETKCAAHD